MRTKKLTELELVTAIKGELSKAAGADSDELSSFREDALKYYYGDPRGDEESGCSQVVSTDVADMLEAVVAGILPAFETDNVIQFEALNDDDAEQAQTESDAVNYFVMEENDGFVFLQEALRDALLLRNGYTKVWIEERVSVGFESFEGVDQEQMFLLDEQVFSNNGDSVVEYTKSEPNEDDPETMDITLKTTTTTQQLKVGSVDPTTFFYSQGWQSIYLDDIPFCGERIYYTRSDLVEMGFNKKKVSELNPVTLDVSSDNEARNRDTTTPEKTAYESSQDSIECFECYYRIDADGDGVAELRRFLLADSTLLINEPYEFVPYATGTGFLQPHRITGLGLYDKLKMVQDVKTSTLRQYLDNFVNGNQGRLGYVRGMVNMDHLTNPRPAGLVEMEDLNSILPIPSVDIGPSAQSLLGYMDTVRSARGGASLDLQSAEAQIMGNTGQAGLERQYSVKEMLAALLTRTLASTLIGSTYKNVHKMLRLNKSGQLTFKNKQGFAQTDPAQWQERNKVNVRGGLSFGERSKKVSALGNIVQQQQMLIQGGQGGIMVDMNGHYSALIDQAKASGVDNPEQYYIDPSTPESQQAAQQSQQQQQQQQQAMQQQQQQMMQMQVQMQEQQMQLDKYKHDQDIKFKYYDANLDAEIDEAKILSKTALDLELQKGSANDNQQET